MGVGLGLKGNFKQRIYGPLQQYRGSNASAGREIGLLEFMQTRAINENGEPKGLKNAKGEPVTMADVWCDLGMDPSQISLENIITLSDEVRYLAPELIRDFILLGVRAEPWYSKLCAGEESVSSLTITSPWITYKDEAPQTTGEAETIAEAAIEWGSKSILLKKKAVALKMSDELLLSVKLPILQYFLRRVGIQFAAGWNREAVSTLENGDQADGSDSCAVIGVKTQNTLAFADFVRSWARGRRLFYKWRQMITDEEMANEVLAIEEFIKPQFTGGAMVPLEGTDRIIPATMPHFISGQMGSGRIMLNDPDYSQLFLTFRGLLVENERIIMSQLNGTAVSMIGGFSTIDRRSRLIVDKSLAYSSHGFPEWMTPLD